jgi:gluconokinase
VSGLPATIVAMGVSGAGKSTFGQALADRLDRPFIDADDLHPAANKAKMAAGLPLTDEDRAPWLEAVADAAAALPASVVACSALKRRYRDQLRRRDGSIVFVELDVDRDELARRLATRSHEFMSPTLLQSQLATLEPLAPDEAGVRFPYSGVASPADGAAAVAELLRHPSE